MAYVRNHPNHIEFPNFRMKVGVMPDFSGARTISQEEPIQKPDGVNTHFTIRYVPIDGSEYVYHNGRLMARGKDYTINYLNKTISFTPDTEDKIGQVPQKKSVLRVTYRTMEK